MKVSGVVSRNVLFALYMISPPSFPPSRAQLTGCFQRAAVYRKSFACLFHSLPVSLQFNTDWNKSMTTLSSNILLLCINDAVQSVAVPLYLHRFYALLGPVHLMS